MDLVQVGKTGQHDLLRLQVLARKLRAFHVPLERVKRAIQRSNRNVGGRLLEMAETEFMVRGRGYFGSIEDIQNVPVGVEIHTSYDRSNLILRAIAIAIGVMDDAD